jgi:hypothetical protein
MSTTLFYIVIAGLIAVLTYDRLTSTSSYQLDVEEKLERLGLEVVEFKLSLQLTRNPTYTRFRFVVRRPGEQTTYDGFGHFHKDEPRPHIEWCDENPVKARAWFGPPEGSVGAEVARTALQSAALEQEIRAEVTARLERIAATPGAILEHDMDGSGHVDALEWEALRAKVRAEVEAERGIAAPEVAPLPTKPPGSW